MVKALLIEFRYAQKKTLCVENYPVQATYRFGVNVFGGVLSILYNTYRYTKRPFHSDHFYLSLLFGTRKKLSFLVSKL